MTASQIPSSEFPNGQAPVAPPHDLDAEVSVLGAILLSQQAIYGLVIEDGLRPEDFYRERHRLVYEAMLELYGESEPVDAVTVTNKLREDGKLDKAGGAAAIAALSASVPNAARARHYGRIVRELALMRRLLRTTYEIQASVLNHERAPRELVEQAERAVLEVAHDDRQKDFESVEDILRRELKKLEKLSREKTALTGTPSGFRDLDEITGGFQGGNLVVIAARPSMGKCQPGSTLVHDPLMGRRRRLDEVVRDVERGEECFVTSLGDDLRLRPSRVSHVHRNGVKPVFRLTTRLGRSTVATANHPFLTIDGWRRLDELAPGARIAVPRTLPDPVIGMTMPDHEIVMLAALTADGCLLRRTPAFCFGADSPVLHEVEWAAEQLGVRLIRTSHGTANLSAGRGSGPNPVTRLCRSHGIFGRRSEDKRVPEAIFGLDEERIARFLGVLYACDGHVHAGERFAQIGYTTISPGLARDVQHLLLRLGIVAAIRPLRRPVYDGTGKQAVEVRITGQDGLRRFATRIRVPGKTAKLVETLAGIGRGRPKTNVDTLPPEAGRHVERAWRPRTWREPSEAAGSPPAHDWHVGTRGISRPRAAQLAELTEDEALARLAASDVWWDEIVSIEPAGEEETFDLTVPGDHNYVADDVIAHNSALVTNIAENAAIQHQKAVALFSLEMSEAELAQRFIASQARVRGDDLRKGKADRFWPKILDASQRLASAPLYVDDSSDIGLLEIRAKARRLHQQEQERGGLGLIIVDYLQLMRADAGVESRVEQVGRMSRGLKILARELNVPVIALSQLSRAVEQRSPKIPMLSDLRDSGNVEQDADLVIFIYRDEYYDKESEREGEADLLIEKHRNGGLGKVTLSFQKEYPRFMNLAREERFAA